MNKGLVCVAGIDVASGTMVRPLMSDGSNWEESRWVDGGYLQVGNLVSFEAAAQTQSAYPHASEDFRASTVEVKANLSRDRVHAACIETADAAVEAIFDGNLVDGKYVAENSRCRSLGCIIVPARKLRTSAAYGKIQVSFRDDAGEWHNFPVTELEARKAASVEDGAALLAKRLAAHPYGHAALRLGLARGWVGSQQEYDPKRCYLQLNGLILPA
ncbi:hypothetical protein BV96_01105 [Sphingomonas paucimobilis]|nr:hypothetical protein BV96_01105 [Sphingomonas paucimobilis]